MKLASSVAIRKMDSELTVLTLVSVDGKEKHEFVLETRALEGLDEKLRIHLGFTTKKTLPALTTSGEESVSPQA